MCEIKFPGGQDDSSNSEIQIHKKEKSFASWHGNLTLIARWCEIVHEVAEEIIKLHEEEDVKDEPLFVPLLYSKHAEVY